VAELYVGQQKPTVDRPIKELKGFKKVYLAPDQSKQVTLALDQRSFAYWNETSQKWVAPHGTYNVLVGNSSADTPLKAQVSLPSDVTSGP
jgi:beta-glucosidase